MVLCSDSVVWKPGLAGAYKYAMSSKYITGDQECDVNPVAQTQATTHFELDGEVGFCHLSIHINC
jgi:hypothetical protein